MLPPRLVSLLFTPANRTERFAKSAASGADGVILDLEDSVALAEKGAARVSLLDWLAKNRRVGALPFATGVRVNSPREESGRADLAGLAASNVRVDFVMVPKVESGDELHAVAEALPSVPLVGLIETVLGVRRVVEIAEGPQLAALAFGGLDLSAQTGGEPTWDALLWPRTQLVHACAGAGIVALDQPEVNFGDDALLAEECRRTCALGFAGKLAIHPRQCPIIQRGYLPDAARCERARRIVAAYESAQGNVAALDGRMIDVPLYRSAKALLRRAWEV